MLINGTAGNDTLQGGSANDTLNANAGDDTAFGGGEAGPPALCPAGHKRLPSC